VVTKKQVEAFLLNAYVDKVFAFVAMLPTITSLVTFVQEALAGRVDIYAFGIAFWGLFIVVPMLIRRSATRISLRPWDWFVTAGRTYWTFVMFYTLDMAQSVALVPSAVASAVFWASVFFMIYARIDLGRSIGLLPAHRGLVTTGVYGWVRHPIHTGQIIFYLAYFLQYFSLWNAVIIGVGVAFVFAKTLVEEKFLKEDEEYREYCKQVPWRWVPWIA
jgi:protein-S-isoprenylcysteine O-methyltransferase Ste14